MRSPRIIMKYTLRNFFQNQLTEHELVIKKVKENLEDNFLDIVQICYKSIKNKNKLIFLVMEVVLLTRSICPQN